MDRALRIISVSDRKLHSIYLSPCKKDFKVACRHFGKLTKIADFGSECIINISSKFEQIFQNLQPAFRDTLILFTRPTCRVSIAKRWILMHFRNFIWLNCNLYIFHARKQKEITFKLITSKKPQSLQKYMWSIKKASHQVLKNIHWFPRM
jgi:hypothetical protein